MVQLLNLHVHIEKWSEFSQCFFFSFFVFLLFYQENDPTLMGRVKKSDAREMQSFYQHYYKKYIQALQNAADKADR